MHEGNHDFLKYVIEKFPGSLSGSVLELGSLDINGSARQHVAAKRYVGIDIVPGPGVDQVCRAAETSFTSGEFDALISISMFEHDPDWERSLSHNLQWLKKDSLIILGWGAEGNTKHIPDPWALVPVADWKAAAAKMPLFIMEQFFENERFTPDCLGAYDVIARKL